MAQKIVLIDGNSLVYRAFYALPTTLATSAGVVTNAVYGFTSMLLRLLKDENPDCVAVAFDKGIVTFRHEIFVDYKAHRQETPDELRHQFGLVKDVLESLNIQIFEKEGYEADDIIATTAKKSADEGAEVRVVTGDKDAFQLINGQIKIITTRRGITDIVTYDRDKVIERYGLPPEKMLDMIGLKGDPSDNIPGVPGIGEKTASKLIQEFGSIDNLMKHREDVKGPKLKQSLYEFEDQAKASKELATLKYDAPVDFDFQKCALKIDFEKMQGFFREMEFNTLIPRVAELVGEEAGGKETKRVSFKTLKKEEIEDFVRTVQKSGQLVIEESKHGFMVAFGKQIAQIPNHLIPLVRDLLQSESVKKISFDLKKIAVILKFQEIELKGWYFDNGLAAYLLEPGREVDYLELASKHANLYFPEEVDEATADAQRTIVSLKIHPILAEKIKKESVEEVFNEIEMPLAKVLAQMEYCGVGIDVKVLAENSSQIQALINKLEEEIYKFASEEFNINSSQQLSSILFEKLMLKPIKKTKTGFSTDATVLAKLINAHPIIEHLINYRELEKLKSTYIDALPLLVNPDTGRLHTTFNQTVTATGRLSSSNPNLQNIPIRTDIGSQIRKAFIPASKEDLLLVADYNQIELRILAYLSGDEKLNKVFEAGEDIHTSTAKEVFLPAGRRGGVKDVTSQMRRAAKAVNFGIVYGISAMGLAEQLNITRTEAQLYIDKYFDKYPKVKQFLDKIIEKATNKGFVTTMFGRKRWLPELTNPDIRIRNYGRRTAVNTVMQGSAADVIKKAMIALHKKLQDLGSKSHMVLQVHDELVLEVPKEEKEVVMKIVHEAMEQIVKLTPALKTNISFGRNWLEAKG